MKITWKCVISTRNAIRASEGGENVTYRRGRGGAGTEKIRNFRYNWRNSFIFMKISYFHEISGIVPKNKCFPVSGPPKPLKFIRNYWCFRSRCAKVQISAKFPFYMGITRNGEICMEMRDFHRNGAHHPRGVGKRYLQKGLRGGRDGENTHFSLELLTFLYFHGRSRLPRNFHENAGI